MANRVIYNNTDVDNAKMIFKNVKSLVTTASSDISNFVSEASSQSSGWGDKAKDKAKFDIRNDSGSDTGKDGCNNYLYETYLAIKEEYDEQVSSLRTFSNDFLMLNDRIDVLLQKLVNIQTKVNDYESKYGVMNIDALLDELAVQEGIDLSNFTFEVDGNGTSVMYYVDKNGNKISISDMVNAFYTYTGITMNTMVASKYYADSTGHSALDILNAFAKKAGDQVNEWLKLGYFGIAGETQINQAVESIGGEGELNDFNEDFFDGINWGLPSGMDFEAWMKALSDSTGGFTTGFTTAMFGILGTSLDESNGSNEYDERGFDKNGNHKNGTKYDDRGFDKDGKHKNGTMYDDEGYDVNGYNKRGFDKDGNHKNGTKYDDEGYDVNGYNKRGFDKDGNHKNGTKYDDEGYDVKGFNKDGTHRNGTKYDDEGYDVKGFNKDGTHRNGTKYDDEGYDVNGYDKDGYNKDGYDKDGNKKPVGGGPTYDGGNNNGGNNNSNSNNNGNNDKLEEETSTEIPTIEGLNIEKDYDAMAREKFEALGEDVIAKRREAIINLANYLFDSEDKTALIEKLASYGYSDVDIEKIIVDRELTMTALIEGDQKAILAQYANEFAEADNVKDFDTKYDDGQIYSDLVDGTTSSEIIAVMNNNENIVDARTEYNEAVVGYEAIVNDAKVAVEAANTAKTELTELKSDIEKSSGTDTAMWTKEQVTKYNDAVKKYNEAVNTAVQKNELVKTGKESVEASQKEYDNEKSEFIEVIKQNNAGVIGTDAEVLTVEQATVGTIDTGVSGVTITGSGYVPSNKKDEENEDKINTGMDGVIISGMDFSKNN